MSSPAAPIQDAQVLKRINLRATLVAAVVAPAITTAMLSVVGSIEDLVWILRTRNASPSFKSLLNFDFGHEIGAWPLKALGDIALSPLLGVAFGFVGAFIFLAIGFEIARHYRVGQNGYRIAGAIVGLVHSAIGLSFRATDLLPWNLKLAVEPVMGWVGLAGGFLLTNARPVYAALTFLAAPIAGALAGHIYGKLVLRTQR
jgi:hypothetical protein